MLLLIAAMVGGSLETSPVPAAGCSIAAADQAPEPQPREESPDESAEDEEGESAKHATVGSAFTFDRPPCRGRDLSDRVARLDHGTRPGTAPIRGPPSPA